MFNLDDILRQAQGGDAAQSLARQFGLSTQQAQDAMDALAPAFQAGLRRRADDPQAMGDLLQRMSSGAYADAYADPSAASKAEGDDLLASLFGSKDGSRAVAQHAAALSGVPASILKAMLPVIASMIMGGMFKQASNQGLGGVLGQLGSILTGGGGGMFGGGQPQPQPRTTQADASGGLGGALGGGLGPLGDILGGMLGGGAAQRGGAGGGGSGGGGLGGGLGPLGDILGQVLGGGAGLPQGTGPQPAPRPRMPQDDGSLGGGGLGGGGLGGGLGGGGLGGGLGDILGEMLGGGRGRAPDGDAGPAGDGLPQRRSRGGVEDEISDMLGGGRAAPQGGAYGRQGGGYGRQDDMTQDDRAQNDAAPPSQGGGSLGDILGQMFETGPRGGGGSSADWNDVLGQILGQRRR